MGPDRRWELIAAAQMTMEMDFTSTLESAMADNPTDIVDAGPQEVSIAAKLVRNAIQKCVRVNSLMRHRSSAEDLRITGPETHRVTPFIREDLSGESGSDSEESDESLSEPSTSIKFPASAASFTAKVLAQRLGSVPRQTATRKSPAREALQFGPHCDPLAGVGRAIGCRSSTRLVGPTEDARLRHRIHGSRPIFVGWLRPFSARRLGVLPFLGLRQQRLRSPLYVSLFWCRSPSIWFLTHGSAVATREIFTENI